MTTVARVRFRIAGKTYYFDPGDLELKRGTNVIVETVRGMEYGTVIVEPTEVEDDKVTQPLRPIIRIATESDKDQELFNRAKEKEAYQICKTKITEHGLEMKLIRAEYTFDNSKLLFYFTADGRIDFRELVKDLACIFHTRIELRQVGVRDETKILGGVGICGRELCCHTFLTDFAPVSIKMAKEQNLSLNPAKISGVCGRLMCCLKNEADTYEYLNKQLPKHGDIVDTPDHIQGQVHNVNILRQTVRVIVDIDGEKEIREYPADELTFRCSKGKKGRPDNLPAEKPDSSTMEPLAESANTGEAKKSSSRGDNSKKSNRGDDNRKEHRDDSRKSGEKKDSRRNDNKKSDNKKSGKKNDYRPDDRKKSGNSAEKKKNDSAGGERKSQNNRRGGYNNHPSKDNRDDTTSRASADKNFVNDGERKDSGANKQRRRRKNNYSKKPSQDKPVQDKTEE